MKPLLTCVPLPQNREKKAPVLPKKKRKRVEPTTPALTFHPQRSRIPSGRLDPPASPSVYSRTSTSESSASSHDEHQTTPFPDCEIHDQLHNGHDTQKRPRIFPDCPSSEHPSSFYPDTSYTDMNEMSPVPPDFQDSPTSSSSPAPPDQSPLAAEFAIQFDYARQIQPMYPPYGGQGYVPQPVVHQDPYSYSMSPPDRPAQSYPGQYPDASYGRAVPHGIPAYPDSDGYPYPPRRV